MALARVPHPIHSELGRETPQRRWYFVSRRGRVGRCQVFKADGRILQKPVLDFAPRRARPFRRGRRSVFKGPWDKGLWDKGLWDKDPVIGYKAPKAYRGVEQPGSSSGS